MLIREISQIYDLIDRPGKVASLVAELFNKENAKISIQEVTGEKGSTEFIKILIPGKNGKLEGKEKPTIGIIGRLGGIGARPERIGFVSDGDGALCALSIALRLARMKKNGDQLDGDVIITTHLCTNAPTEPHDPVPFMGSPVSLDIMNKYEVDENMDAIISIDTSRGNEIINTNGFAITPTVKQGWILRVSNDLLRLMKQTTGSLPAVVPITMQDITPYSNGLFHFNSLMTPSTATNKAVVGVAITSEVPVPGCATGVTNLTIIDSVGRFVIEVAKEFVGNKLSFFNEQEFDKLVKLYGDMAKLQK